MFYRNGKGVGGGKQGCSIEMVKGWVVVNRGVL